MCKFMNSAGDNDFDRPILTASMYSGIPNNVNVGEIHTTDRTPEKMTVSELIYILQKLEGDRDVKVHIRHKGLDCSWERDLLMVFQNDGDEFVSLCVDI